MLPILLPLLFLQGPFSLNGDSPGDNLGSSLAQTADLNGDNIPDYLVGASGDDTMATDAGAVLLLSGADGTEIFRVTGTAENQRLGWFVCSTGDLDGDSLPDFATSSKRDNGQGYPSGLVHLWSSANGSLLRTYTTTNSFDRFGYALSNVGDVNADGLDDLLVGAPEDSWQGAAAGAAYVYSGADGSILHTFRGKNSWDLFGISGIGMGDIDFDGYADFAIGARQEDTRSRDAGGVHLYSGRTGAELALFKGRERNSYFGVSLVRIADLDGDGKDEIGISALNELSELFSAKGYVEIWSVNDLDQPLISVAQPSAGDGFGRSLAAVDLDTDGVQDLLIGAPLAGDFAATGLASGAVYGISGRSGRPLLSLFGNSQEANYGANLLAISDINGDDGPDFLVSAPGENLVGWVGTQASPTFLHLSSTPLMAGQSATLSVARGLPHSAILFHASLQGWGWTPLGPNIGLDLAAPLYDLGQATTNAAGEAQFSAGVPTSLLNRTVWVQCWEGNIYGPEASSNALELVVY